jgi:WD40 repeat protein
MKIQFEQEYLGHSGAIYNAFVLDGFLYSASSDRYVGRWDLETGEQTSFVVQCTSAPYSLFAADNYLWIGLSSGDMHIIQLDEKKEVKFIQQHQSGIFHIGAIPNSHFVLSSDADGMVHVWHKNDFSLLMSIPFGQGKIRRIVPSEDGKLVFIPTQEGKIHILETNGFNEIAELDGHKLGSISTHFDSEFSKVYSVGKDGQMKRWSWPEGKLEKSLPVHYETIYEISELNGLLITASRDKTIKIWNKETLEIQGKITVKEKGHTHSINGLIPLENGFISFSDDKKLKRWSVL